MLIAKFRYYCNYGINPDFKQDLKHPQISVSGVDPDDEICITELAGHKLGIPETLYLFPLLRLPDRKSKFFLKTRS